MHKFIDHINGKSILYNYDNNNRLTAFRGYKNDEMYNEFSSTLVYNDKGKLSGQFYYVNFEDFNIETADVFYHYNYRSDDKLSSVVLETYLSHGRENLYYDDFDRLSGKSYSYYNRSDTIQAVL